MAENPSFEIPPELRDMAEKNVEQARAAYGQFMDFVTQAMGAWATAPGGAEMSGFRAAQERAIAFAKENAERSFALASDLARAKDVQEVLDAAKPLRADADADLRHSGPTARLADGRRDAQHAVQGLKSQGGF